MLWMLFQHYQVVVSGSELLKSYWHGALCIAHSDLTALKPYALCAKPYARKLIFYLFE